MAKKGELKPTHRQLGLRMDKELEAALEASAVRNERLNLLYPLLAFLTSCHSAKSLKPYKSWSRFADTPWRHQRESLWLRALLLWHSGVREHEDGTCPVSLWCVWLTLGA